MDLILPELEAYAERLSTSEDELLQEVHRYTYADHAQPHMMSGHLQGKLLESISYMMRPRRILEIGTFTGYSALCLAKGLSEDGQLHTIELRPEDVALARRFFDRSVNSKKIISHGGNALDIIPTLNETWDLVFIDADKPGYIDYFKLVLPSLRQNGFILCDNIFFHGEVLKDNPSGKSAKAIIEFNEYIRSQEGIDKLALTIRDGIYLLRKL